MYMAQGGGCLPRQIPIKGGRMVKVVLVGSSELLEAQGRVMAGAWPSTPQFAFVRCKKRYLSTNNDGGG
jgi:hypothetical protein